MWRGEEWLSKLLPKKERKAGQLSPRRSSSHPPRGNTQSAVQKVSEKRHRVRTRKFAPVGEKGSTGPRTE
jgi:hypothetical protein